MPHPIPSFLFFFFFFFSCFHFYFHISFHLLHFSLEMEELVLFVYFLFYLTYSCFIYFPLLPVFSLLPNFPFPFSNTFFPPFFSHFPLFTQLLSSLPNSFHYLHSYFQNHLSYLTFIIWHLSTYFPNGEVGSSLCYFLFHFLLYSPSSSLIFVSASFVLTRGG